MHSPRAIQLNGLDAHLLHVLCCRCLYHSCAAVKRFTPKGDGALVSKYFIIISIFFFFFVAVVVVVVVVNSSVYFIFSLKFSCCVLGERIVKFK